MLWGAAANAAVTLLGALTFALAFFASLRRPRTRGSRAVPALFGTIALFLLLAALRQCAAAFSDERPGFVDVDRTLFFVLLVPAAASILPMAYLVAAILTPSARRRAMAVGAFLVPVTIGITFVFVDGIEGPITSAWGTDWTLVSIVPRLMLLFVILIPSVAGSIMLVRLSRRLGSDAVRVRRVGWACLLFFTVFTLDAFGLAGLPLLMARILTTVAGLVAWKAYPSPAQPVPASLLTQEAWRRKAK